MKINDLNYLHVFLALMQTHSTQRAAAKIGRSQSYVSKVLSQLRAELDDPLFTRSAEGLSPTSYAMSIHPKLINALEQVSLALEPEEFHPENLDLITLHFIEPMITQIGKGIISKIREQTDATIELRTWHRLSQSMILEEEVDLGLHVLNDKPQSLYQKKMFTGSCTLIGNMQGEYMKFAVSGVNDHENRFQVLLPDLEASLYVDNYNLLEQLLDMAYTMEFRPNSKDDTYEALNLDVALVSKASRRKSPKVLWLSGLIEEYLQQEFLPLWPK